MNAVANTLAYYYTTTIMDVKCFIVQAPGEKIHAKVFNVLSLLGLDNLMRHARCAISFGSEPTGGLVRVLEALNHRSTSSWYTWSHF